MLRVKFTFHRVLAFHTNEHATDETGPLTYNDAMA